MRSREPETKYEIDGEEGNNESGDGCGDSGRRGEHGEVFKYLSAATGGVEK